MKLITTQQNYNFWQGVNKDGQIFYNVTPENQPQPNGGYFNSDYICQIKGVLNHFKN